ncbi:MAG: TonB-dependent receptor, partial [Gammaproteobacteria bacterium]|nr:TonB-dependent receptor [Gammaproteobacteria bacterium]
TRKNLFTLRERKSRFIIAIKNQSRKARSTTNAYMKKNLHKTMKTLTLDNNPAFALHPEIAEKIKSDIYFCEPYKSYQKGGIENANKLLRTQLRNASIIKPLARYFSKLLENYPI